MDQNLFRNKQTFLDLNGPNLSFTTHPSNQSGNSGDNASFIGIATATFPNAADNEGSIAYQWYEVGIGKLSDGGKLSGTTTTTLTISNLVTPGDDGRKFYVEADYIPKLVDTGGGNYQTGNAFNEPLNSGIGTLTVADEIEITSQPIPITGIATTSHSFNVVSNLSGVTEDLSFQWQVDGINVSDGTLEKKTVDVVTPYTVTDTYYSTGPAPGGNITGFNGGGIYWIYYNSGIQQGSWNAGSSAEGSQSTFGGTEAFCLGKSVEQIASVTGTTVQLGDFRETKIEQGDSVNYYAIDVVTGISTTKVVEQTFDFDTFLVPANATDIRLDLGAGCGGAGASTHLNSGGAGGDGMTAWFSIPTSSSDRVFTFDIGRSGNDGIVGTDQFNPSNGGLGGRVTNYTVTTGGGSHSLSEGFSGGNGAKSGSTGLNGSGGGGSAPTTVRIDGVTAIVLGGGAGGGGASESGAGTDGADAGPTTESVPFYGLTDSDSFSSKNGVSAVNTSETGAGGGGSGGGAIFTYNSTTYSELPAGTSGSSATGGSRGHSAYRTSLATYLGGSYNRYEKSRGAGSGWAFLSYTTTTSTNTNDTKTTTVTGAETASLTLSTDKVGVAYTVGVQITGTASNSPLTSDIVGYNVVSPFDQSIVNIEAIGITTSASLSTINLSNGPITFTSSDIRTDNTNVIREYVLYSPERDIDVEMDMYGGKGYDNFINGTSYGGQGGFGRIRFTLERNVEYVLTGLSTSIGAPALYRKASLLAVVGQGGSGGQQGGQGGKGGGPNMNGQGGSGTIGGGGGSFVVGVNGIFGSIFESPSVYPSDNQAIAPNGGSMLTCPKGIYWAQQGVSQCSDVGTVQYRLSDGSIVANTSSSITRGYKSGYNIIETAGAAVGNAGIGGNGAAGGFGGSSQGGGGGGSGYASGSITVVVSNLGGGEFNQPRVILRLPGTL